MYFQNEKIKLEYFFNSEFHTEWVLWDSIFSLKKYINFKQNNMRVLPHLIFCEFLAGLMLFLRRNTFQFYGCFFTAPHNLFGYVKANSRKYNKQGSLQGTPSKNRKTHQWPIMMLNCCAIRSKDQPALKISYVTESSNLIDIDNFGAKTHESHC